MTSEPTPEMIEAGRDALMECSPFYLCDNTLAAIYAAMCSSLPNPEGMTEAVEKLFERLLRKEHKGQFAMGGGTIDATGKATTWGGEKIMEYANPDGPTVVRELRALLPALSTRSEGQVTEALRAIVAHARLPQGRTRSGRVTIPAADYHFARAALSSTSVEPDEDAEGTLRLLRNAAKMLEDWEQQDERPTLTGFGLNLLHNAVTKAAERISSRDDGLRGALDDCRRYFAPRAEDDTSAAAMLEIIDAALAQGSDRHG